MSYRQVREDIVKSSPYSISVLSAQETLLTDNFHNRLKLTMGINSNISNYFRELLSEEIMYIRRSLKRLLQNPMLIQAITNENKAFLDIYPDYKCLNFTKATAEVLRPISKLYDRTLLDKKKNYIRLRVPNLLLEHVDYYLEKVVACDKDFCDTRVRVRENFPRDNSGLITVFSNWVNEFFNCDAPDIETIIAERERERKNGDIYPNLDYDSAIAVKRCQFPLLANSLNFTVASVFIHQFLLQRRKYYEYLEFCGDRLLKYVNRYNLNIRSPTKAGVQEFFASSEYLIKKEWASGSFVNPENVEDYSYGFSLIKEKDDSIKINPYIVSKSFHKVRLFNKPMIRKEAFGEFVFSREFIVLLRYLRRRIYAITAGGEIKLGVKGGSALTTSMSGSETVGAFSYTQIEKINNLSRFDLVLGRINLLIDCVKFQLRVIKALRNRRIPPSSYICSLLGIKREIPNFISPSIPFYRERSNRHKSKNSSFISKAQRDKPDTLSCIPNVLSSILNNFEEVKDLDEFIHGTFEFQNEVYDLFQEIYDESNSTPYSFGCWFRNNPTVEAPFDPRTTLPDETDYSSAKFMYRLAYDLGIQYESMINTWSNGLGISKEVKELFEKYFKSKALSPRGPDISLIIRGDEKKIDGPKNLTSPKIMTLFKQKASTAILIDLVLGNAPLFEDVCVYEKLNIKETLSDHPLFNSPGKKIRYLDEDDAEEIFTANGSSTLEKALKRTPMEIRALQGFIYLNNLTPTPGEELDISNKHFRELFFSRGDRCRLDDEIESRHPAYLVELGQNFDDPHMTHESDVLPSIPKVNSLDTRLVLGVGGLLYFRETYPTSTEVSVIKTDFYTTQILSPPIRPVYTCNLNNDYVQTIFSTKVTQGMMEEAYELSKKELILIEKYFERITSNSR